MGSGSEDEDEDEGETDEELEGHSDDGDGSESDEDDEDEDEDEDDEVPEFDGTGLSSYLETGPNAPQIDVPAGVIDLPVKEEQVDVKGKKRAIWHDPSDDVISVDLESDNRLKKLARGTKGTTVNGEELMKRLRKQYVHPTILPHSPTIHSYSQDAGRDQRCIGCANEVSLGTKPYIQDLTGQIDVLLPVHPPSPPSSHRRNHS